MVLVLLGLPKPTKKGVRVSPVLGPRRDLAALAKSAPPSEDTHVFVNVLRGTHVFVAPPQQLKAEVVMGRCPIIVGIAERVISHHHACVCVCARAFVFVPFSGWIKVLA